MPGHGATVASGTPGRRLAAGLVAAALAIAAPPVASAQQTSATPADRPPSQAARDGGAATRLPASLWTPASSPGPQDARRPGSVSAESGGADFVWGALLIVAGLCAAGAGLRVGRFVRPVADANASPATDTLPPFVRPARRFRPHHAGQRATPLVSGSSAPSGSAPAARYAAAQPSAVSDAHPSAVRVEAEASASGSATVSAVASPAQPAPASAGALRPLPARASARRLQQCAVVASRLGRTGEFRVIVREGTNRSRTVARSTQFPVPPSGVIPEEGQALDIHREMIACLAGAGWRQVDRAGQWYEQVFVKPEVGSLGPALDRAVVVMRAAGDTARFEALLLGEYGNATSRRASRSFSTSSDREPDSIGEAEAAHRELIDGLAADGWQVAGRLDRWYATTLQRRRAPWP